MDANKLYKINEIVEEFKSTDLKRLRLETTHIDVFMYYMTADMVRIDVTYHSATLNGDSDEK